MTAADEAAAAEEAIPEEEVAAIEEQLAAADAGEGAGDDEEVPELDEDMQAAIAGGVAPSPDVEGEDDELDGEGIAEHLKESVEGSFRMKRLLERDVDDDSPAAKKARLATPEGELIHKLLTKWSAHSDGVIKYVLHNCTLEEMQMLDVTQYFPDKNNMWKSAADLLIRHCNDCRERKMAGGGPLDCVSTFKFRWKLDAAKDKMLRQLNHKDLRYVLNNYDGNNSIDELIKEAALYDPEEESTETALPDGAGVSTIGRFGRLELIDPLADAAVFGDANLTFAIRLAQHRKALGHVGRVIATTFEDVDTLRERYKEIDESIKVLEDHFAEVHHGVDCTRIAVDSRFVGMEASLGAVYYNFPHSGAVGGFFDGHPLVNWRHENLMRLFFRALRSFVKPGGIVKVASNMGAVGVRYSYIVNSAVSNEFIHVETVPFLEWHLHRYGRSYGDRRDAYKRPDEKNNQSYNAQRAEGDMLYCFCYAPSGESVSKAANIVIPPSLETLMSCTDGPFKSVQGQARSNLANQLRKRFVTEASGVHVG
jgi:hypothetical protein